MMSAPHAPDHTADASSDDATFNAYSKQTTRAANKRSKSRNHDLKPTLSHRATKKQRRTIVDWNRVEGNWKQVKGKVKEKWGQLTDDDLNVIAGRRDQLEGKIQERYGLAKDQVRKDVDDWMAAQRW
jgi:uncharacterized protein YjbJ (UPF0337 family)